MQRPPGSLCIAPVGLRGEGIPGEQDTHAACCTVRTRALPLGPRGPCLLLAPSDSKGLTDRQAWEQAELPNSDGRSGLSLLSPCPLSLLMDCPVGFRHQMQKQQTHSVSLDPTVVGTDPQNDACTYTSPVDLLLPATRRLTVPLTPRLTSPKVALPSSV